MIDIIQVGTKAIEKQTYQCINCNCIFTYTEDDIGKILEEIRGFYSESFGIKCPCCGKLIDFESLRLHSSKIVEEYTYDNVYNKKAFQRFLDKNKEV